MTTVTDGKKTPGRSALRGLSADAGAVMRFELEELIRTGEWPEGHRLPGERSLATQFGVSRAIVREVLQDFRRWGIVQVTPARGTFVRRPDGSALSGALTRMLNSHGATARDVFEARVLLETEVAARAAHNLGGGVAARLRSLAEDIDDGDDRLAQAINDLKFHSLMCIAAQNPVLTAMHRAIAPYVLFMTLRRDRVPDAKGASHVQIVDAVCAGDETNARVLAEAHLDSTKAFFGPDFDRSVNELAEENLQRISAGIWTLDNVVERAFNELDSLVEEMESRGE